MSWDEKFMGLAREVASWSKDPSTKVGCVIVDDDHTILATGYNGFPRGMSDDRERYEDRSFKMAAVVHAEANAVAAAARTGRRLMGATAYVTLQPCSQCAGILAQAGVRRIISISNNDELRPDRIENFRIANQILSESGIASRRQE